MNTAAACLVALRKASDSKQAKVLAGFFKTGKGQYGEGDVFLGLKVPQTRLIARQCGALPLPQVERLMRSPFHEARLLALLILVERFQKAEGPARKKIASFYLKNKSRINNWDLVDLSAPYILGPHIREQGADDLRLTLARSKKLWDRRLAMVSTFADLRAKDTDSVFRLAALFMDDREDLMHKACGWLLREAGKVDLAALRVFLKKHSATMPRTMLRYAIERMTPAERQRWMNYAK
jgi:3-methyladenine DNA glycosylase AlkD